ncbi:hypothetical protein [Kordiimonas marina]|uniref:hypothetical protein n=1 Tax=Kordiimonas marina TaxID=2872312 RepID=UPI001FF544FD|nr:hypothetical protein [Kordiimonas marina]MCJ9430056.1 hypothetical protein [Kordiimonas marina]
MKKYLSMHTAALATATALGLLLSSPAALATTYTVSPASGDNTQNVQNKLSQLHSGDILQLGSGTFNFTSLSASNPLFNLKSASGITIEGAVDANTGKPTTTLVIGDNYSNVFALTYASNITIKNFIVRRSTVPFTEGVVQSVNESTHTVTVTKKSGFADFTNSLFTNTKTSTADPFAPEGNFTQSNSRSRIKPKTDQKYDVVSVSKNSDGVDYDVTVAGGDLSNVVNGDGFILRKRTPANIVNIFKSHTVTIQNMISEDAPGILVAGTHNSNVTVDNLDTQLNPYEWTAGNADGINLGATRNLQGATGHAVVIMNCDMDALGDDFVNLHGLRMMIDSKIDNTHFTIKPDQVDIEPNDQVTLFRPSTGGLIAQRNVSAFGTGTNVVTLSASITNAFGAGDLLFDENAMDNSFLIHDNHFTHGRRNGLFVRGNNGEIYNNTFEQLGASGVHTESSGDFFEAYRLANTSIHDNTFRDNNLANSTRHGMILVTIGGPQAWKANTGLKIYHNTFTSYQGAAVWLEAVDGATIGNTDATKENTIESLTSSFFYPKNYMFRLNNHANVDIQYNKVTDGRTPNACIYSTPAGSNYTNSANLPTFPPCTAG